MKRSLYSFAGKKVLLYYCIRGRLKKTTWKGGGLGVCHFLPKNHFFEGGKSIFTKNLFLTRISTFLWKKELFLSQKLDFFLNFEKSPFLVEIPFFQNMQCSSKNSPFCQYLTKKFPFLSKTSRKDLKNHLFDLNLQFLGNNWLFKTHYHHFVKNLIFLL